MAGLVAAVRLRELGHDPRVVEKGSRPGGSMLLSACVVWRHLDWETFRAECPGGDERLQRLIWERLDDALGWLEALVSETVWRDTENPLTTGRRYDPRALTALLAAAAGDVELQTPLPADAEPPVLLATGGFGARLARERGCSCGRIPGARATGSTTRQLAAPRPPPEWTSSTAASCRLRRRGSARRTSSRWRSSTAARRASSPTTGERSRRRRLHGTRTISR